MKKIFVYMIAGLFLCLMIPMSVSAQETQMSESDMTFLQTVGMLPVEYRTQEDNQRIKDLGFDPETLHESLIEVNRGSAEDSPNKKSKGRQDAEQQFSDAEAQSSLSGGTESLGGGADGGSGVPGVVSPNVQVEPGTGTSGLSIPIEVPPGRGGIQPNINLVYNSNLKNNFMGVGWTMELGSIEVDTKKGQPTYTSADTYVLNQQGSRQKLIYDSVNDVYRPEIEGAFMEIKYRSASKDWMVIDRNGTKYFFGQSSTSRLDDPGVPANIFKWCLDRVEDVHGNYMTITYSKMGSNRQLYPIKVDYTGHVGSSKAPYASVEFSYDIKENLGLLSDVVYSWRSGFAVWTAHRLKEIKVKVGADLQRRYALGYTTSPVTKRSLLTSITQYGADDTTSYPPMSFTYTGDEEERYVYDPTWDLSNVPTFSRTRTQGVTGFHDHGMRIADVNNDGYSDFVKLLRPNCDSTIVREVYINNKTNGWALDPAWQIPVVESFSKICNDFDRDLGVRLSDLNGDGWIDVVRGFRNYPASSGSIVRESYLHNQIDGWGSSTSNWLVPTGMYFIQEEDFGVTAPRGVALVDVNGDGYVDVVSSKEGAYESHAIYLNNMANGSTGWSLAPYPTFHYPPYSDIADGAQFVELNADGLPDILYLKGGTNFLFMHFYNTWLHQGNFWINTNGFGDLTDGTTQFADVNGDGLTDLIVAKGSVANGSHALINTGYEWNQDDDWIPPAAANAKFKDFGTRLMDVNGDGLLDYVRNFSGETPSVYLGVGTPTDLLLSVDNGLGATTNVEYTSSAYFNNTYLPMVIQVVKKVTVSHGTDSYTTEYEYGDGLWDIASQEFRGFGMVKIIDPEGSYTVSRFAQDDIFKGRPVDQASYDASDNLFSKTENTWNSESIATGVNFAYLERTDNYVYDGDATGKRTAQEYFYEEVPQRGNLTRVVQLGEVNLSTGADIGTDSRTVETQYHNNTTVHLLGIPKQTTVKDHGLNKMRESFFYYDNNVNLNDLPVKGLLTKKIDWAGDRPQDVDPETEYSYDAYGNLLTTTDPRDHVTTIAYDSGYQVFPLTTTNALSHTVINEYYGVDGVPLDDGNGLKGLWGQLKTTTDPNNQIGKSAYDTFGRVTMTISPLDSVQFPTTTTEYSLTPGCIKIKSHQRIKHGQPEVITAAQYFDGLGRLIQNKTRAGFADTYTVSGQSEYNSRGLTEKQYLPFFTSNDFDAVDPINPTNPHTTVVYDAMGRVTQTTNPDGSYSSVIYDDWVTETIDENGHKQSSEFDAYGRLITRKEFTGADGRGAPYYPQTAFAVYATTQYVYDSEGSLAQTIDDHSNSTSITYDKLGRKISMTDPDMGGWQYEYDTNGNLAYQIDAKSQQIDFTYDELNRLTNKTDGADLDVDYTYDDPFVTNSKGRLTHAGYGLGNDTQFMYDVLGRENESIKQIESNNYQVKRQYDALNRLIKVEYPTQENVFYQYNEAGQIKAIANDETLLQGGGAKLRENRGERIEYRERQQPGFWNNLKQRTMDILSWAEEHILGVQPAYAQGLPSPWNNQDVGNVAAAGSASENAGTFTVIGSGADIWMTADEFHYAYQTLSGDGEIIARVDSIGNTDPWAKAGVMIREYLSANAKHAFMAMTRSNGTAFQRRTSHGGSSYHSAGSSVNAPYWVRLTRTGNTLRGYESSDGQNWTQVGPSLNLPMTTTVYIGLAVTSHNDGVLNTSVFDNVSITGGGSPPTAPTLNSATPGDTVVDLSWGSVAGATGYKVHYGQSSQEYTTIIDVNNVTSFQVQGLTNNTTYYFAVSAYNTHGESGYSNELSATPVAVPSAPVQNDPVAGDTVVDLSWGSVSGADGYKVFAGTASGAYGAPVDVGNVTSFQVQGLTNETEYFFAIKAYNVGGESAYSNEKSAIPTASGPVAILFVENVEYNAAGQITRIEYGNGTVTVNTYDPLTLRLSRIYTEDAFSVPLQDLNYVYDKGGNIVEIVDNVHTADQTFVYDEQNRLVSASGATYGTKTFQYDEIGNIIQKDGKIYTYGQSGAGPHAVTSLNDGTIFGYDANGNMLYKSKVGEDFVQYFYDVENRLVRVDKNEELFAEYAYDGDGGRVRKVVHGSSGTSFLAGTPVLMADGSTKPIEEIMVGDYVLAYDEQRMEQVPARVSEKFTRDYFKEYLVVNGGLAVTPNHLFYKKGQWDEVRDFTTDDVLMTAAMTETPVFDIEKISPQASVTVYNMEVEHAHNYYVGISQSDWSFSHESFVLVHNALSLDGGSSGGEGIDNPIETRYVGSLYEEQGGNNTSFVFLGDTRIAALTDSGDVSYYHSDHLGGTNVISDEIGTKVELLEYLPFGGEARKELYGSNPQVAWYYFTGKPKDDETGLYYYGARYYDPVIGRFITADTIVPGEGNPQAFNRYSYVINNPVNLVDPDGHGFFSKLFNAFKNAIGSFLGAIGLGSVGAFIGTLILPGIGTAIGAFVLGNIGAAAGQTIQHGGNLFSNLKSMLVESFKAGPAGFAGYMLGGRVGMVLALTAYNVGSTLVKGGSIEDAIIAGIVTSSYAVAAIAYYDTVGAKIIQKGVDIHNARKAGALEPTGKDPKPLKVDRGEDAANEQALKLKVNYDVEGKIKSFDLVPEESIHSPDYIVDPSGQAFPVPKGAQGPKALPSGKNTGVIFSGGRGGVNGQVDNIRIMNPRSITGNAPAYESGYAIYGNKSNQAVNPYTGRTVSPGEAHFPLKK